MSELSFYINNVLVPPPEDWGNLELELDFVNRNSDATIRNSTFEWKGENAARLFKWFKDGLLTGGVGIFEGPTVEIRNCNPAVQSFYGCVDMTSPDTRFQCDIVRASVKETLRSENALDRMGGFSFAYLASAQSLQVAAPGFSIITNADFKYIPSVISSIPDWFQVAILTTSFVEMTRILKDTITGLESLTDKLAGDITAATATGGLTVAQVVFDIIVIILYVAYILFLISLLVNLFLLIINNIIQPVKYKAGMYVVDLIRKACDFIGIGLSSTILQGAIFKRLAVIPTKTAFFSNNTFVDTFFGNAFTRKYYDDAQNTTGPFAAFGWFQGTPLELIHALEDVFDAKAVVRNNTLFFEVWDAYNNQSTFTLPNQSSDAPYPDPYGTNADELVANYLVRFALDSDDFNTYDNYEGTNYQMILQPVNVNVPKNVLLKGLTEKALIFARVARKKTLTVPEKIFNFMYNVAATLINPLISAINAIANLVGSQTIPTLPMNPFGARIGMALFNSDFIGTNRLVLLEASTNKVDVNNDVYVTAKYLQENFHSHSWAINTLSNSPSAHNQYLVYKDKEIPLCCSDFLLIKNNNIIKTFDQKFGRVDSLRWNPHTQIARIDYRVKQKYTNNLTQTFLDGKN